MDATAAPIENVQARINEIQFDNFKWIDIYNPSKEELDRIAKQYDLDYFQVKDSLEMGHLPKYERGDDYQFLILRGISKQYQPYATTVNELSNKIAFFFDHKNVITIHRADFDFIDAVKPQFASADALVIYLINRLLKTYIKPYKEVSEKNDAIEKIIFVRKRFSVSLEQLYYQKAQTRILKKLLVISQGVINQIEIQRVNRAALQDLKDGLLNWVLSFEEEWENANNLLGSYLNVNAQKTNDVMKLLTVFSAFFLPLTFIAGIYGMNFDFMPELRTRYGYFAILCVMVVISLIIFIWFKRKRIL